MSLEAFLHDLHFDTDKTRPPDLEVDWDDAPLPYKLYRGLPVVPLSAEVPLTLEGGAAPAKPNLRAISHFLWYTYGLTRFCQTVLAVDSTERGAEAFQSFRRFVPSGGALYPNELYVYLKLEDVPAGVYHYDAAHHRLVLLRDGHFDDYLARALGHQGDLSACFGAVFVSVMYWKNFFKYHNFACRLQGLDAGVLIGQLLEVAKRFGFATGVCFQFLDRSVNHLLGLSEREESVYAVIPLSVEPTAAWFGRKDGDGVVTAADLCRELPAVQHDHWVRSRRVREYPMLINMYEASVLDSTASFRQVGRGSNGSGEGPAVALPRVERLSYDLASVCRMRYSPGMDFVLGGVSQAQLAALLQEATASFSYQNDLDEDDEQKEPRVSLYGCFCNVDGVPDGAYRYDSAAHALRPVQYGDFRHRLQAGMTLDNVNLFQVPLCLHVAGERDHLIPALGYRGYRIQQMEAGMLVQRILLAATAMRMGGHPLLGYDANVCDELYKLAPRGLTTLIQVPVGPCRHPSRLEGGLHA